MEALKDLFRRNRFDVEESSDSESEDSTSHESDNTEGSSSDSVYPDGFVPPPRKSKYYSKHKKQEKKMHRKHTRNLDEEDSDYLPFKSHKQHSSITQRER